MWKICVSEKEQFMNVEKIFPTQQRDVSTLLNSFIANQQVKKVIVFGSSVTSACNPWSDIDVYVELTEDVSIRKPRVGVPVDLWTNFDVDSRLLSEITEKGVLVYERRDSP